MCVSIKQNNREGRIDKFRARHVWRAKTRSKINKRTCSYTSNYVDRPMPMCTVLYNLNVYKLKVPKKQWKRKKLNGVGPVDNRSSINKLHHIAKKKKNKKHLTHGHLNHPIK